MTLVVWNSAHPRPRPRADHRQLMTDAWGPGYAERPHYLRIYMKPLREKLVHSRAQPEYLRTETGVGYRLRN